jgi:hypothetical protein
MSAPNPNTTSSLLQLITLQTQWFIPSYSGVDSASVIDINTIEIDGW